MRLRNQLVIPAETFAREENFFPVVTPTLSKDKDEQLKQGGWGSGPSKQKSLCGSAAAQ